MQPYITTMHWDLTAVWQFSSSKQDDIGPTNRAHGQHCW